MLCCYFSVHWWNSFMIDKISVCNFEWPSHTWVRTLDTFNISGPTWRGKQILSSHWRGLFFKRSQCVLLFAIKIGNNFLSSCFQPIDLFSSNTSACKFHFVIHRICFSTSTNTLIDKRITHINTKNHYFETSEVSEAKVLMHVHDLVQI